MPLQSVTLAHAVDSDRQPACGTSARPGDGRRMGERGLLGQLRFPKTLNQQLRV